MAYYLVRISLSKDNHPLLGKALSVDKLQVSGVAALKCKELLVSLSSSSIIFLCEATKEQMAEYQAGAMEKVKIGVFLKVDIEETLRFPLV